MEAQATPLAWKGNDMATVEELMEQIEDLKDLISALNLELAFAMKAVSSIAMTNAGISFALGADNQDKASAFYEDLKSYVASIEEKANKMVAEDNE